MRLFETAARTNGQVHAQVRVDRDVCGHCGACVIVCPVNALFLTESYLRVDTQTCTLCDRCVRVCPVRALSIQPDGGE